MSAVSFIFPTSESYTFLSDSFDYFFPVLSLVENYLNEF